MKLTDEQLGKIMRAAYGSRGKLSSGVHNAMDLVIVGCLDEAIDHLMFVSSAEGLDLHKVLTDIRNELTEQKRNDNMRNDGTMSYEPLAERSNWGVRTLHWPDGTEAKFGQGELVDVMWPNGDTSEDEVHLVHESHMLYDSGREYQVRFTVPHVRVELRGVEVDVPLLKLKVWRGVWR